MVTDFIEILESRLLGSTLVRKRDGKAYQIDRVFAECWTLGDGEGWWLWVIAHDEHKSSITRYWQNITCTEPLVVSLIEDTRKTYDLATTERRDK